MSDESVTPVVVPEAAPAAPVNVLATLTPTQKDHWRLTGELPSTAAESALPPAELAEGDGDGDSDPEPSPAVAAPVETPTPGKPRHDMKARLGQITAEKKAAIARAEAAERRAADLEARLQPAQSQPAPQAPAAPIVDATEPNIDQFMDQPDPYAALAKATARWAVNQFKQEQALERAQSAVRARMQELDTAGQAKYPDWTERLSAPDVNAVQLPPHVMHLLHTSPFSVDVLYHLSKHPAEVRALAAMEPITAAKTIGSLETRLSGDTSRPAAKTTSDAPPPPTTLGTKPAVPGDELDAAITAGDFSRYRELANARDLAGARR